MDRPPLADPLPTALAALPSLVLGVRDGVWLSADGEVETLDLATLAARARDAPPLIVHRAAVARRFGQPDLAAFDLLELWAFALPARFCLPTPRGLAVGLGQVPAADLEDQAAALGALAARLIRLIVASADDRVRDLAARMAQGGWLWGPLLLQALGDGAAPRLRRGYAGLDVWARLPEWQEAPPPPPPRDFPVEPAAARHRLAALLGGDAGDAEERPQQADYASAAAAAFDPREAPGSPVSVLAEAGTGVGKTLGYLAPASLWTERNGGPVWISTYTRNLQSQIETELDRLYPDPAEKAARVVIRKGRENYLCLLNFEEATRAIPTRPADVIALGLMARWAGATRDGALVGGDFPGWLADLLGRAQTLGLADRRGECVYSACPHYQKCFIERSVRQARHAAIVIANHALVMIQLGLGGPDDGFLPTRYVFDEGHHVFEAADGAFSALLSGRESGELRRWILGADGGSGRARGLRRRIEDLIADDEDALALLQDVLVAAAALPGEGWLRRVSQNEPRQAIETFLSVARRQVLARAADSEAGYELEAGKEAPVAGLLEAAAAAERALGAIEMPLVALKQRLERKLDTEAEELDTATRLRLDAMSRGLERRATRQLGAWRRMLRDLAHATPEGMVDWFSLSRADGRDSDVGLHRHWIDPTLPFAAAIAGPVHGLLLTSATLADATGDSDADWEAAEARTGTRHFLAPPLRARVPSPFDYAAQTRVFVVTDVRREDLDQVATAYRALFLAAGGGGLGLFTAIQRLRAVHERIAGPLDEAGLMLLAQHVDGIDIGTLIDIFRAEENACLLGTDAVRDGVDVPGRSLRLIVFDRVPWPRPDILHRARRAAFGGRAYDDMLTRLKLRQAFGRLIRRADDRGVFVLLDAMMPSRLAGAFPEGAEPRRIGLKQAIDEMRAFLQA
jgi:ATP-dependent DNA helicase DinG